MIFSQNRVENRLVAKTFLSNFNRFAQQFGMLQSQNLDEAIYRFILSLGLTRSRGIDKKQSDFAFQPLFYEALTNKEE